MPITTVIPKTCKDCKFANVLGKVVECHRFPPNSDGQGENSKDSPPIVDIDGWCGEYGPS